MKNQNCNVYLNQNKKKKKNTWQIYSLVDCTQQTIDDNDDDGDVELLLVEEEKIENFFLNLKVLFLKK